MLKSELYSRMGVLTRGPVAALLLLACEATPGPANPDAADALAADSADAASPDDATLPSDTPEAAADIYTQRPEPTLSLVAARGGTNALAVVTGALPGVRVVLYGSLVPEGPVDCPAALGGTCLGLSGAGWVAEAPADPAGVATFAVAPRGSALQLQAATWGTGGATNDPAVVTQIVSLDGAPPTCPGLGKGNDPDGDGLDSALEATIGTDPCKADTDGDSLSDGAELKAGTSPLRADSDNDGLTDAQEAALGTNPMLFDTDKDALSDGMEVSQVGTDPLDPDSDGDGKLDGVEVLSGDDPLTPDTPYDPDDLDADGIPNWLDVETCDGLDNNGDGQTDEGFATGDTDNDGTPDCLELEDCDCVDDDGDGRIAEHCRYNVTVMLGGGSYQAMLDGAYLGTSSGAEATAARSMTGGRHVIATQGNAAAGATGPRLLGRLGGATVFSSNDADWQAAPFPPGSWATTPAGPAAAHTAAACVPAVTGTPTLDAAGALGVVGALGSDGCATATFVRVSKAFVACGDVGRLEVCNGLDDTGEGLVDEGLPDADGDGICDAIDIETCDGLDNDGDGLTDEGQPDNDNDGICNGRDWEICNGIDDDGDGLTDEGVDLDGDGLNDCAEPLCGQSAQPLLGYAHDGQLVSMNAATGARTVLSGAFPYFSDLVVAPNREVWSVGNRRVGTSVAGTEYAVISKIHWGPNPVAVPVMELGPWTLPNVDASYNEGSAITFDVDGTMLVGFASSIWRVDPVAHTATELLTDPNLEFIRDFTWYRGHLLASGWRRGAGPVLYRWNRQRNRLEDVHSFGGFRPQSLACSGAGELYAGLGSNFCSLGDGACTYDRYVSRFTPETGSFQHLYAMGPAENGWLHAAEFPDGLCQSYVEVCDGIDNDLDGQVDEGQDLDQNGVPDCIDGLGDADGDGVANRDDIEICDQLDNDGDGVVDNHVDLDGNGISDCTQNVCTAPAVQFVANGAFGYGASRLLRWLPASNSFVEITGRTWTSPSLGDELWIGDLAVSSRRGLYAIGDGPDGGGIYQLDPRSRRPLRLSPPLSLSNAQVGLALDPSDTFYYSIGAEIFVWSAGGTATLYATAPAAVTDLSFHRGALWAVSKNNVFRVQALASGAAFVTTNSTPLNFVTGISGGSSGPLYVARCNGTTCPIATLDTATGTLTPVVDWFQNTLPYGVSGDALGGVGPGSCQPPVETCDGWDNTQDGQVDEGFPDSDGDGIADCVDPEVCNCDDDDGDGETDEGCVYELAVHVAADDLSTVWVDGQLLGAAVGWTHPTLLRRTLPAGSHRVGLAVGSSAGPAAGVRAALSSNGSLLTVTGDSAWRRVPQQHGAYLLTSAVVAAPLTLPPWPDGGLLDALGAQWLWLGSGPKQPATGGMTVTADVFLCGANTDPERCDGLDNDGDGLTDEGFAGGGDGPADCAVAELLCDGVDNDGDGLTDEGFADSDLDGRADCAEDETCDGLDNDGDGETDEGYDADEDGVPDCFDVEVCDGKDNDGDGLTDEGFDLNTNGVPDCAEPEACDCIDNDGDGETDETCEYTLSMALAGSAGWQATLDGAPWGADSRWNRVNHLGSTVSGGVHLVAVKVDAGAAPIAGFVAQVSLNGQPVAATGQGLWRVGLSTPAGWTLGVPASFQPDNTSLAPPPLLPGVGAAEWVWSADGRKPKAYPTNAYVLAVTVCGELPVAPKDVCNGLDDNGNGVTDEGFDDDDKDGIANCVDDEILCDGKDNDGDGFIDEGLPDTDMDGVADCVDKETCDGLDNDGDGSIDESPACGDVPETLCNCIDDDLDGVVDDGCLYAVTVTAQAPGDVQIWLGGEAAGQGPGTTTATITGLAATQELAVAVSGTLGAGKAGGLRVGVDQSVGDSQVWERLEVAAPPLWSGSAAPPAPTWVNEGFDGPATESLCAPAGKPALADAPWLWGPTCDTPTLDTEYRVFRRVVICPEAP